MNMASGIKGYSLGTRFLLKRENIGKIAAETNPEITAKIILLALNSRIIGRHESTNIILT